MLADDQLFTGTEQMIGYDQASHRAQSSWFWSHQLVVAPDTFYAATGNELFAVRRATYGAASLRRKGLLDRQRDLSDAAGKAPSEARKRELKQLQTQLDAVNQQIKEAEAEMAAGEMWRVPCDCDESLVLAGNVLLAGGDGKVLAFDVASGQLLWTGEVDGKARGLAVADGRLFVSSDTGTIYCFGPEGSPAVGVVAQPVDASPFPADELTAVFEAAAERIVQHDGDRSRLLPGARLRHGPAGLRTGETDGTADLRCRTRS